MVRHGHGDGLTRALPRMRLLNPQRSRILQPGVPAAMDVAQRAGTMEAGTDDAAAAGERQPDAAHGGRRMTARRYGALLVDPPWKFEAYSHKGITTRSAESKYRTAPLDALKMLPVGDIAAKDSCLFLWAVDSHLDQAIQLMHAWGFTFKTVGFVWVKTAKSGAPRMSMGLWTRKMSEICLLGTRGKPRRKSGGVRQIIMAPRREHSRKPDEVYSRIEALVAGPYCEFFARQRFPGWDVALSDEADHFTAEAAE